LVTRLPAATAAVADVELVMNFRRDTFGSRLFVGALSGQDSVSPWAGIDYTSK
jgi:hypothetical protein